MDILIAFVDKDAALLHLRQCFSVGASEHGFSSMLLSRIYGGGQFVLVAKPGLDLVFRDLAVAGSYSGKWIGEFSKLKGGLGNSILLDFAYVLNQLSLPIPHRLFVENIFGVRRSNYIARFRSKLVYLGDRLFHLADQNDIASMYCALGEANTIPFTKGFCSTGLPANIQSDELSTDDSKRIVDGLTIAFTTALDGEAFLLWIPADSAIGDIESNLVIANRLSQGSTEFALIPYSGPKIELE